MTLSKLKVLNNAAKRDWVKLTHRWDFSIIITTHTHEPRSGFLQDVEQNRMQCPTCHCSTLTITLWINLESVVFYKHAVDKQANGVHWWPIDWHQWGLFWRIFQYLSVKINANNAVWWLTVLLLLLLYVLNYHLFVYKWKCNFDQNRSPCWEMTLRNPRKTIWMMYWYSWTILCESNNGNNWAPVYVCVCNFVWTPLQFLIACSSHGSR